MSIYSFKAGSRFLRYNLCEPSSGGILPELGGPGRSLGLEWLGFGGSLGGGLAKVVSGSQLAFMETEGLFNGGYH